eukprot:1139547-Pelagomonas_calceolata.AAC.19
MEQQALSQMHGGVTFAGMDFIATGTHGEVLSGVMKLKVLIKYGSRGVACGAQLPLHSSFQAETFFRGSHPICVYWSLCKPCALCVRAVKGKEVAHILESNGVIHFPDAFTTGFGWDPKGETQFSTDPSQALLGSPQDDLGCNHT